MATLELPFSLIDSAVTWQRLDEIAAAASPLVLVCGCVVVLFRPRLGLALGLLGALLALPLLVRMERTDWSSWTYFNSQGSFIAEVPEFAKLRILSIALVAFAVATSGLRLLPTKVASPDSPLRRRVWPGLAIAFCVLAIWFVQSVTPYQTVGSDHPPGYDWRILHVRKQGLRFHETDIAFARRMGQAFISRQDRQLFQYQFESRFAVSALGRETPGVLKDALALTNSPALWKLHTQPAKMLWSWNAEGWYVVLKDSRLVAFTSEYGTTPPREVTDLFYEIEKLPSSQVRPYPVRDVCMGFSYDPVAALQFSVLRQRMRLLDGK